MDGNDPNLGSIPLSPPCTSQQLFMGAHGADADLLVDHVNPAEAECGVGLKKKQKTKMVGVGYAIAEGIPKIWGGRGAAPHSPVKADLVQALLAGLVHGVEPGAGVLLLPAVCKEKRLLVSDGGLGNPWWGGPDSPGMGFTSARCLPPTLIFTPGVSEEGGESAHRGVLAPWAQSQGQQLGRRESKFGDGAKPPPLPKPWGLGLEHPHAGTHKAALGGEHDWAKGAGEGWRPPALGWGGGRRLPPTWGRGRHDFLLGLLLGLVPKLLLGGTGGDICKEGDGAGTAQKSWPLIPASRRETTYRDSRSNPEFLENKTEKRAQPEDGF